MKNNNKIDTRHPEQHRVPGEQREMGGSAGSPTAAWVNPSTPPKSPPSLRGAALLTKVTLTTTQRRGNPGLLLANLPPSFFPSSSFNFQL
jgi:hypothetical protein